MVKHHVALLLLSNCLKGYTKGMCLYKVIPLHTIFTVTKIQLQKQNNYTIQAHFVSFCTLKTALQ